MERCDVRGKKAKVSASQVANRRDGNSRECLLTLKRSSLQNRMTLTRPIYERVERVSSSKRRPVVLFGPLLTPIIQTLLDDSSRWAFAAFPVHRHTVICFRFSHCVPECRALQSMEVERLLASCELIEARRRETLYDVITAPAIHHFAELGYVLAYGGCNGIVVMALWGMECRISAQISSHCSIN